ncbi:MAG: hypothetical protein C0197_04030 [Caldimicrobium thiodismutans]|uniref:Type-4 uracil-DNA glycosylase n=1 Tax=Caldimicrobium thiodismutans TaxID=1653476 RepID=A0A2N7PJ79_9BACT|nr:MAG: hypothetical protein C0197_04030 [Caldimicrobium thiodismutans]
MEEEKRGLNLFEVLRDYFLYYAALGFSEIPFSKEFSFLLDQKEKFSKDTMEALFEKISKCEDCKLSRVRKHPVLDKNYENKRLMLIGDFPDRDDDYFGWPFSGPIKDVLQRMLFSIGLRKEDFYITLAVKCKPPAGRLPEEDEIEACKKYLLKEIRLLKPKLILALGFIPPKIFMKKAETFSSVRGNPFSYKDSLIIFTYHPSYMLKNPAVKRLIWEDLKTFKRLYEENFNS